MSFNLYLEPQSIVYSHSCPLSLSHWFIWVLFWRKAQSCFKGCGAPKLGSQTETCGFSPKQLPKGTEAASGRTGEKTKILLLCRDRMTRQRVRTGAYVQHRICSVSYGHSKFYWIMKHYLRRKCFVWGFFWNRQILLVFDTVTTTIQSCLCISDAQ